LKPTDKRRAKGAMFRDILRQKSKDYAEAEISRRSLHCSRCEGGHKLQRLSNLKDAELSTSVVAAKKARVATAVAGSGGPYSAAPSNRVDEVESSSSGVAPSAAAKQLPSHAGRVLNTGSNDVAQLTATCQEPRSTMVFMKILEPIWANEVADGQKMFECVANKTKWQNQFKQLASGDLIVVVMKGRAKVNAVCEVASPAKVKETNRDVLKSKLQESRHEALDAYLDGAESFDYVEFKHVFDCRCFLSVSSTAAFLERVGLALPKTPLVGLLRPVVLDEQWHSRLHEYMQQAVLRIPVPLATAIDKDASKQTLIALVQSNDSNSCRIKRDIASLRDSNHRVSRRDIADQLLDSSSEDLIIGLTKQINKFR
jgi:hypothetical protein